MTISIKIATLLFIIIGLCSCSSTQSNQSISLQSYDISDLDKLIELNDRPIAIFIHADWCSYCRNMEQTTFKDPHIRSKLNSDYYYISFDGEQKNDIRFQNKTYHFNPHGTSSGTHELATKLAQINEQVSYPTFVIIHNNIETAVRYNTFLSSTHMAEVLAATENN